MSDIATQLSDRKNSYDYDDLIKSGHGELFGKENGRLPKPPMLMLDRISYVSGEGGKYGKGELQAELDIRPDLWFSIATSRATRSCRAVWGWTRCGSLSAFIFAGPVIPVVAGRSV
jgi:hypothetical protein